MASLFETMMQIQLFCTGHYTKSLLSTTFWLSSRFSHPTLQRHFCLLISMHRSMLVFTSDIFQFDQEAYLSRSFKFHINHSTKLFSLSLGALCYGLRYSSYFTMFRLLYQLKIVRILGSPLFQAFQRSFGEILRRRFYVLPIPNRTHKYKWTVSYQVKHKQHLKFFSRLVKRQQEIRRAAVVWMDLCKKA